MAEYRAKKDRVRRGELCYYCMERPPTKMAIHTADGTPVPACDACAAEQVKIGKARSRTGSGCLLMGVALIAVAIFLFWHC